MAPSVIIPIVLVAVWALLVGAWIHDGNVTVAGRIGPRPTIRAVFDVPFFIGWGVPTVIYLLIWGGIFWW